MSSSPSKPLPKTDAENQKDGINMEEIMNHIHDIPKADFINELKNFKPDQMLEAMAMLPEMMDGISAAMTSENTNELQQSIETVAREISNDADAKSTIENLLKKANIDTNAPPPENPMDLMLKTMDVLGNLDADSIDKLSKMINKSSNGKAIKQLRNMINPGMMEHLMKQAQKPPPHNKNRAHKKK